MKKELGELGRMWEKKDDFLVANLCKWRDFLNVQNAGRDEDPSDPPVEFWCEWWVLLDAAGKVWLDGMVS